MTFNPRALWVFVAFVVVLLFAVSARAGRIDLRFALAGVATILIIEVLVIVGPALSGRWRERYGASHT
jgi:hypothetical protein